jgi:CheY-like chemotaxis protein
MKKILIVDDDATTRHVVRRVLTGAGFSVAVAKDGVEGLKALKARRFDLLLLDVWMPRLTGLELLARLRTTKAR